MATTKKSDANPWVSICIATYQRHDFLRKTLEKIRQQEVSDFEVIVSDNDPTASSRVVVENFRDERFKYFVNEENLGIVGNFNAALKRSSGQFVVMMTDDDPPYTDMLSTLYGLEERYPGFGCYYGACDIKVEDTKIASLYGVPPGINSQLSNRAPNEIKVFPEKEFPVAFFENRVFPYFLWSTGIIRREVALAIGGVPDYGTAYLGDFAFICLCGAHSGCVTINKSLGFQTIHSGNFGRQEFKDIRLGVDGFIEYVSSKLSSREGYPLIQSKMSLMLANWSITHAVFLDKYFEHYHIGNRAELRTDILKLIFNLNLSKIKKKMLALKFYWKVLVYSKITGLSPVISAKKKIKAILLNR